MARTSGGGRQVGKAGEAGRWRQEAHKLVRKAVTGEKSRDDRAKAISHCAEENIHLVMTF